MKRQKRDMSTRAFEKGYTAGTAGRSRDICPSEAGVTHQEWMNGWREGRQDMWSGMTGVSGIHRHNEVVTHHQH
jgi:ribosome modulation factor